MNPHPYFCQLKNVFSYNISKEFVTICNVKCNNRQLLRNTEKNKVIKCPYQSVKIRLKMKLGILGQELWNYIGFSCSEDITNVKLFIPISTWNFLIILSCITIFSIIVTINCSIIDNFYSVCVSYFLAEEQSSIVTILLVSCQICIFYTIVIAPKLSSRSSTTSMLTLSGPGILPDFDLFIAYWASKISNMFFHTVLISSGLLEVLLFYQLIG